MNHQYKQITDQNELMDHIHMIHGFLRNHGVGMGMTALKIFNLFYGLKIIDGRRDRFNPPLSNACSWKYLRGLADYELIEAIVGRNSVLDELYNNPSTRDTIFYDIPRDVQSYTYRKLMEMIERIPENTYDVELAGKIYEYFIGYQDKTNTNDICTYSTDRHITQHIMEEIKPRLMIDLSDQDVGHVPSMIDPFGGSGGFTLTYTRYMNEKYGGMIDWKDEINKIYHYDMNEDVVKSASLEMFALTGIFPSTGCAGNFKRTNSFKNNYGNRRYMYVLSNPPYGGDKNKKSAEQLGIERLISCIKSDHINEKWAGAQLKALSKKKQQIINESQRDNVNLMNCHPEVLDYARQFGVDRRGIPIIDANDKEACSLLLFMSILDNNGICACVLQEKIFVDRKYTRLRRALIERFNILQVISIPSDQFENITKKTSILIFQNNGRTKKVVFSEMQINKYTENSFQILDNHLQIIHTQGQIKEDNGVEKVYVGRASYDQISGMSKGERLYSLDAKKYRKVN